MTQQETREKNSILIIKRMKHGQIIHFNTIKDPEQRKIFTEQAKVFMQKSDDHFKYSILNDYSGIKKYEKNFCEQMIDILSKN